MIRVLSVISDLNFGGGENRLFHLARAIDPARFRLTVVTLYSTAHSERAQCGSMRRQFAEAGIEVHDLGVPHPATARGVRLVKLAHTATTLATVIQKLRRLIVESRADLVDAHLETALYTAVPAAASAAVPAAITLYSEVDLWKILDARSIRQLVFPSIRRLNLRLCSAIITDAQVRAEDLRRYAGASAPPTWVIPNGVRLDQSSRSRADVLRDFGISANTRATILGQVAGLVPFKGQAVFLEAAKRIIDLGHDVYVLCVGYERLGPRYPEQLRGQAQALGISERVRLQGYSGNIADAWNVIDVHVHPASIDSLPNAIIEGMSLGKPAVVSSVGAIPDHVEHGRTGLLVRPDDPMALADAICRVLTEPGLAERLGRGAYERYLERFTPEVTARQVENCFASIVEGRGQRRAAGQ